MIPAFIKRLKATPNGYIESNKGQMPCGEWVDENGHTHRMICIRFPTINLEGEYGETLYRLMIKPNGLTTWSDYPEKLIDITSNKYVWSATGKRCTDPFDENGDEKPDVSSQVQFFGDMIVFNIYNVPVSFVQFIKNDIENTCGVTFE